MDAKESEIGKPFYEVVFVVLVYRNVDVLKGFFHSLTLPFTYKVIVVNSYCDEASDRSCRVISEQNDADFLSVPNKGFGAGNNVGCHYAMEHYQCRYLILSNSDIVVRDLGNLHLATEEKAVYAADVQMENGHRQNPHLPFRVGLYLKLLDLSYRKKSETLMSIAFAFNRVLRELVLLWTKLNGGRKVKVFSAHGSFIVFTFQAAKDLYPIFNEEMFLYNEELYLAHRCRMLQIPVYYDPRLMVTHLEGASSTKESNAWKNHEDSYMVLSAWLRDL